jgi:hypothetical protein
MAPFDLGRARDLLHFTAELLWKSEERVFDPALAQVTADD